MDAPVELARIGLATDRDALLEPHAFGDQPIQLLHLAVVASRQQQERRLRAGRAFDAAERQPTDHSTDFVKVEGKVLRPKTGTLANRHRLRHLKVRVTEAWLRAPDFGERRQVGHHGR